MPVRLGYPAPAFEADAFVPGKDKPATIKLEDYKGQWVVLFFYTKDFSPICPVDVQTYSKHLDEFTAEKAVVLGASTDSWDAHKVWHTTDERVGKLNFPLLADRNQEVSRAYGVLIEEKGVDHRGTFIIDPEGVVRYISMSEPAVGAGVSNTLRYLRAIRTGKFCPADWEPGKGFLN